MPAVLRLVLLVNSVAKPHAKGSWGPDGPLNGVVLALECNTAVGPVALGQTVAAACMWHHCTISEVTRSKITRRNCHITVMLHAAELPLLSFSLSCSVSLAQSMGLFFPPSVKSPGVVVTWSMTGRKRIVQRLATTDGDDRDPKCVSSQFRKLYFSSTAIPPERFLVRVSYLYIYMHTSLFSCTLVSRARRHLFLAPTSSPISSKPG